MSAILLLRSFLGKKPGEETILRLSGVLPAGLPVAKPTG
jgi:hypothetical protein